MMLHRLLCLCIPGSAYRQIVPVAVEDKDENVSGMQLILLNIKKKFTKEELAGDIIDNDKDCITFVESIKIEELCWSHTEHGTCYCIFADPTNTILLSFLDPTLSSVFRTKSPHGISPLCMLAGKTILRSLPTENTEFSRKTLITVVTNFLDVFQRHQRSNSRRQDFTRTKLSKRQLNTLSTEGSIVLTVCTYYQFVLNLLLLISMKLFLLIFSFDFIASVVNFLFVTYIPFKKKSSAFS